MKKILLILSILFLSSCYPNWYKPYGKVFKNMPKKGTAGFRLGWKHGCESGLGSQFGGSIMMTFYTWDKDPYIAKTAQTPEELKIIRDKYPELKDINWNDPNEIQKNFNDYKTIFWNAHSYCHGMILGALQNAGMNPKIPGNDRFVPGEDNLNSIYRIDGRGDARWTNW